MSSCRHQRLDFRCRSTSAFRIRRPFTTTTTLLPVIRVSRRCITCAGIRMYVWYCNLAVFVRSLMERFSLNSSFASTETKKSRDIKYWKYNSTRKIPTQRYDFKSGLTSKVLSNFLDGVVFLANVVLRILGRTIHLIFLACEFNRRGRTGGQQKNNQAKVIDMRSRCYSSCEQIK